MQLKQNLQQENFGFTQNFQEFHQKTRNRISGGVCWKSFEIKYHLVRQKSILHALGAGVPSGSMTVNAVSTV